MTQTIVDLWSGSIAPYERCGVHDREGDALLGQMERHRKSLCEGLQEGQKEVFQKYMDCLTDYWMRMQELAFCDGYCQASKLMAEALR